MILYKIYKTVIGIFAAPIYLSYFFKRDVGHDYGLGFFYKIKIILRFRRNSRRVTTASSWREQLRIAAEILRIPPTIKGDVIECGCYKGGSSTNLSLICDLVGRKLVLCDSFEGLPGVEERDKVHYNILAKQVVMYEKGRFAGGLDEVKHNINRFGEIGVCKFVKGYYEDTLNELDGSYVLAFVDVDLHKSLEECLISLWPRLVNGAYFFSHEAQDLSLVSLFFNKKWWAENLNSEPPGLVGAGTGLPVGIGRGSSLGYAVKGDINSHNKDWAVVSFGEE
jgi:hypothetical protein